VTVTRKVNREMVVLLGWGRAILLQLAHPAVATGVAEHSSFGDGIGGYARRAHRTVGAMIAITFGTAEQARATVARINAIHMRVKGATYSARDPRLLNWVNATLMESLPLAYERFVGPLTDAEKDRYCAEAADFAPAFGIPPDLPPRSRAELDAYMKVMLASGELRVTQPALTLAAALLSPPWPLAPFYSLPRLATVGLLPPAIREAYGFDWNDRQERRLGRVAALVRSVRPFVPSVFREWPAARRADRSQPDLSERQRLAEF
jgi:uncharacterized protein (DUF2236 family)